MPGGVKAGDATTEGPAEKDHPLYAFMTRGGTVTQFDTNSNFKILDLIQSRQKALNEAMKASEGSRTTPS